MWGIFLKVRGGVGPKAIQNTTKDVANAVDLVRTAGCAGREPLEAILARTPSTCVMKHPKLPKQAAAWQDRRHPKFLSQHGLTTDDLKPGEEEFLKATARLMLPREQHATWLELCRQRKLQRIPNWEKELLVADCGSSLGWLSIARDMFPCVRPGNKYIILQHGAPKVARGLECLAVQGIGAQAAKLLLEDDQLLRALAGDAFCANICCAFFVAALLAM